MGDCVWTIVVCQAAGLCWSLSVLWLFNGTFQSLSRMVIQATTGSPPLCSSSCLETWSALWGYCSTCHLCSPLRLSGQQGYTRLLVWQLNINAWKFFLCFIYCWTVTKHKCIFKYTYTYLKMDIFQTSSLQFAGFFEIISKNKTDLDPDPDGDQKLSRWPLGRTHATCHILSNGSEST